MKSLAVMVLCLLLPFSLAAGDDSPAIVRKEGVHTWENVGEITQITGKSFLLRRTLRLTEASWSLLSGTVSSASQLQAGDRIHARGNTLPDGTYDTRRIYLLALALGHSSSGSGGASTQTADYGGPNARNAARDLGYPVGVGPPGTEGQSAPRPPIAEPGGGIHSDPGTTGNSASSSIGVRPRFLPGDVEGIVEVVASDKLILSQVVLFGKETDIRGKLGEKANEKALQVGARVAVTLKDEVDEKSRGRKATVIRVLP
ncbi:MAG: hypothetical protein U0V70_02970 [Terriglobia bacterium]